ncbi:MAG: acyl-CoA dehydrogenase family protein [Pseudomonadota bacterium]|nr:acyl-CoA dehydrogenase family protein [Pseudomonadota bacterium]
MNQPPPIPGYNQFASDAILRAAVEREGAGWAAEKLSAFGRVTGSERVAELARDANRKPPELRQFDAAGGRLDEVIYHPAYHELMGLAKAHEVHSIAWTSAQSGGHVAHMALEYLLVQADAGVCCPITMTYAALPALRKHPALAGEWQPRITAASYDARCIPAAEKTGVTIGMAMTEKQGGSDVRANTTRAQPIGSDGEHILTGHKWFCSAPMSDAFLTLAQTDAGLSCFLVARWLPDGTRNPFLIQRLKDKLGDHSNASCEIEYSGTLAHRIGEDGQGVRTIIEMVHHTRLDTALAAAGLMRQAVVQAVHHTSHRRAFGRLLSQQPLMRNVLADLVVEWAAATLLAARVARSFDEAPGDPAAAAFSRLAVAVAKFWINKRLAAHVCEALECHGGSGYVEESIMPRLYRQAPLNGIWEGSGNVICLDVLRTLEREPMAVEGLLAECAAAQGGDPRLDRAIAQLKAELADGSDRDLRARRITTRIAVVLQAALLVRHGPPAIAEAFCASRLEGDGGRAFGTLPAATAFDEIIGHGRISP